ncbi:MAG: hypothetical protein IPM79_06215 [Polyangiaceae bacterium]|nr:hypothetical protein [Polyangiaceae bacterium]
MHAPRRFRFLATLLTGMLALGAACTTESTGPKTGPDGQIVAVDGDGDGRPDGDGSEPGWGILTPEEQVSYAEVVRKVTGMVQDSDTSGRVTRRGMNLINVMWEDTGRFQGSSVGPNISDLTLQVRYTENGQPRAALLPVIRFPNFSDRTGDIPAEKFFVRTGNQKKNGKLETVLLTDVLKDVKSFVSDPKSVKGSGNLLAKRDTHFLVSAQAVFLPVPKKGHAEFTPVLFNYQSFKGSPAVATILVTRQGTSMTVIENDGSESSPIAANGQELYFNKGGERAPFTAERRTDVVQRIEAQGGPKTEDDRSAIAKGADTLFIIQVPLKQKQIARGDGPGWGGGVALGGAMPPPQAAPAAPMATADSAESSKKSAAKEKSDVEQAVLGHGKVEGKFFEGRNLQFERDDRFPIRVTVQFYKATSNGVVEDSDLDAITRAVGNVYEHADFVGSLVMPEDDAKRPTAWQKMPNWFGL